MSRVISNAVTRIVVKENKTITVGAGQQFANISDALRSISNWIIPPQFTVTISVIGNISVATPIAKFAHPYSSRIQIRGPTVIAKTISSISSVTGSTGAWVVTATLNDATDVAIGDTVLVRNISPGIGLPGSITTRPVKGQFNLGFFSMGLLSTTGTAATLDGSTALTFMADGDLVFVQGETRQISGLTNSGFTLNAAFTKDISILQYWYHLRSITTGTIESSGTTVTGTGTAFLTDINVGDIIFAVGYGPRRVTAIASDTSLTVHTGQTISAGTVFGVMTLGEMHEGAWVVTGISGSNVTWTNKNRTSQSRPPVNNVIGGSARFLKASLQVTGAGQGFQIENGTLDINGVAIIGSGGTSSVGIDCRGTDRGFAGRAKLGADTAVIGFGYNIWVTNGGSVFAENAYTSSALTRNINVTEGAQFWGQGHTCSASAGINIFIGTSSGARLADFRSLAAGEDGIRSEVGGTYWGDFCYVEACGAIGILFVGASGIHIVGSRIISPTEHALYGGNKLEGRGSGMLLLCGSGAGITAAIPSFECGQMNVSGFAASGLDIDGGIIRFPKAGVTFNTLYNVIAENLGLVEADGATFVGSGSINLRASTQSRLMMSNCGIGAGAGGVGCYADTGAEIWVKGYAGSVGATTPAALNQVQADGSVVRDGLSTLTMLAGIRVGTTGGDIQDIYRATQVNNLGTVSAQSTSTFNITVTGCITTDTVLVGCNAALPSGVTMDAQVSATNTVTVRVTNVTGAGVTVGNRTYTVHVFS